MRRLGFPHDLRQPEPAAATNVWRYFFLVQPPDLPERLVGADPDAYLRWTLAEWCGTADALTDDAVAEYRRCFDPTTIHASFEDYRAGATIDLRDDSADAQLRITCPTLALWSRSGLGRSYDVAGIWRERASDLTAIALDCGHFIAEERPIETTDALLTLLSDR
jgi:haloacetate dehalogenase